MDEDGTIRRLGRALELADRAWNNTHRGLPSNPMTRAAAIPATGILAAAVLDQMDPAGADDAEIQSRIETAITVARHAWELTHRETPGNPIAATAARSVIGILAAGILNSSDSRRDR